MSLGNKNILAGKETIHNIDSENKFLCILVLSSGIYHFRPIKEKCQIWNLTYTLLLFCSS